MIGALTLLLSCQLAGEILVRLAHLPLPGPVLGLVLLFAILVVRGGPPLPVRDTALGLLAHLSLLFVPAGVGVITHIDRLRAEWLPLLAAVLASTALTIVVTAGVFRLVWRLTGAAADSDAAKETRQ
jgi:putative effector of murein hydrolase LrgA (UPF0299 family)